MRKMSSSVNVSLPPPPLSTNDSFLTFALEVQVTHKVIEFVLYKFNLEEKGIEDVMPDSQYEDEDVVDELYEVLQGLYDKTKCSYALAMNNGDLEVTMNAYHHVTVNVLDLTLVCCRLPH